MVNWFLLYANELTAPSFACENFNQGSIDGQLIVNESSTEYSHWILMYFFRMGVVVNVSHLCLLLLNFNKTWHKAYLDMAREGWYLFIKGDNSKITKIHWQNFKKMQNQFQQNLAQCIISEWEKKSVYLRDGSRHFLFLGK